MDTVTEKQEKVQCEVLRDSVNSLQCEVLIESGQSVHCEELTDSGETVAGSSGHSDTGIRDGSL